MNQRLGEAGGMNYLPLLRTYSFFFFIWLFNSCFSFFIYLTFFFLLFLSEVSKPKRNSFNTRGGQRENGRKKRKRNNEKKSNYQTTTNKSLMIHWWVKNFFPMTTTGQDLTFSSTACVAFGQTTYFPAFNCSHDLRQSSAWS